MPESMPVTPSNSPNPKERSGPAQSQRPTVVASVKPGEFERFLAPNLQEHDWPFELSVVDPVEGVEGVLRRINELGTPVLITCWSTKPLPEDIQDQAPSLRYACHLCGTVRRKIPRKLIERGLLVSGWGNSIARIVAEHSLLQVLGALRRLTHWQLTMHTRGGWSTKDFAHPESLFERTVGLHGFGAIARELTRLMKPFDCRIWAYSPSVPDELFAEYGVGRCNSLEELFSSNQIIVELAPLKPENVGLVTEELLNRIQPGGVFVNTGRGAVVDEQALAKVAARGQIHLALDVFVEEPLPADSPLRGLDNVLLTPHIGGPTMDRQRDAGLHALRNVQAYFAGEPISGMVGTKEWDRQT